MQCLGGLCPYKEECLVGICQYGSSCITAWELQRKTEKTINTLMHEISDVIDIDLLLERDIFESILNLIEEKRVYHTT